MSAWETLAPTGWEFGKYDGVGGVGMARSVRRTNAGVERCLLNSEFLQGPPAAGVTVVRVVPIEGATVVAVLAPEGADAVNEASTSAAIDNPQTTSHRFSVLPGVTPRTLPQSVLSPTWWERNRW